MQIYEIFKSVDNDGTRIGFQTTFIRTFSCNLNCSYCDSDYCVNPESDEDLTGFTVMDVEEIMAAVEENGLRYVKILGGEPLLQRDCPELVAALLDAGYYVTVETQGKSDIATFEDKMVDILADDESLNNLVYVLDYKCPNSGMHGLMNTANINFLIDNDVIKFVVSDATDIAFVKDIVEHYEPLAELFVTPYEITGSDLVTLVQGTDIGKLRVQLDLRKEIYGEDMHV